MTGLRRAAAVALSLCLPATGLADALAVRPLPLALPRIDVGMLWHRRHERDTGQRWLRAALARAARRAAPRVGALAPGTHERLAPVAD